MIFWMCSAITLSAAVVATFSRDGRRAALSLWITGLGAGGLYLSLGAELLAIVQWIVSTLVAISFIFYAVMFGEYGEPAVLPKESFFKRGSKLLMQLALGITFGVTIWFATKDSQSQGMPMLPAEPKGMLELGRSLVGDHLLSLEVLALTLFLVLVGAGSTARPEAADELADEPLVEGNAL